MVTASELPIDINATAMQMAEEIFGSGVTVVGASYTGDTRSSGIYTNGDAVSDTLTPADTGVILSTGQVRDVTNSYGEANQTTGRSTNTAGVDNDAQFNAIAGTSTYDAAILDIDFVPTGDFLTLQFTMSSEEYPEYYSTYSDTLGVWINGNFVESVVGGSVGDVNPATNQNLYLDNTNDTYNTEMDGLTVTLTLKIPVNVGVLNSLRIGIADGIDSSYDTNLLIAGNSGQTVLTAVDDSINLVMGGTHDLDVLANDANATTGTLSVTHINGQPISVGQRVVLNNGQEIMLNADGTLSISTDNDLETTSFTYTVTSSTGEASTANVIIDTIPCFVAGTLILTDKGEIPVEHLEPGDLVFTHDQGYQPLRWIGKRSVPAKDKFAPIRIAKNALGNHNTLLVSPQHRILIRDALAELLFGHAEVLVAAKDLINDHSIQRIEGGEVEYVHILFDQHQVVLSEGLATESFLPGPQSTKSFEKDQIDEICALFPELDPLTGGGYSASARRTLKKYEANILVACRVAA